MREAIQVPECAVIYCPRCNKKLHPTEVFHEGQFIVYELPCGHKETRFYPEQGNPFDCYERKCHKL